jgi:hypothetical protein
MTTSFIGLLVWVYCAFATLYVAKVCFKQHVISYFICICVGWAICPLLLGWKVASKLHDL